MESQGNLNIFQIIANHRDFSCCLLKKSEERTAAAAARVKPED